MVAIRAQHYIRNNYMYVSVSSAAAVRKLRILNGKTHNHKKTNKNNVIKNTKICVCVP